MRERIDFKALTLILGIIIALIILLFVQVFNPTQSVSLIQPLEISLPINIQEIGTIVLKLLW
jgi:hypothetical protein